jgi:hypothetical protein
MEVPKTKRCSRCKLEKPAEAYYADKSRHDGLNHRCKDCNKIHSQSYRRATNARRKYELAYYYGITVEEYDRLESKCGNVCEICRTRPEEFLAVDHCHTTGKVRGLLCRVCNSAIGFFRDDPDLVQAAKDYLLK